MGELNFLERKRRVELQIPAASSNIHLELPLGKSPFLSRHIPVTEIASPELESDSLASTSREVDLLETAELSYRLVGNGRVTDIQLRHVGAIYSACVGDLDRDGRDDIPEVGFAAYAQWASGVHSQVLGGGISSDSKLAVLERSVREAVTEWVADGHVGLVEVAVVKVDAFGEVALFGLADADVVVGLVLGDCVGQLGGGVDVAVEDVGDGVAGFLTQGSGVEDCGYVVVLNPLVEQAGTGGGNDDDGVVAVRGDGFDHGVLILVVEFGAVGAFA